MAEPEAVTGAEPLPVKMARDMLSWADAATEYERRIDREYVRYLLAEYDVLAASVRDREAAAWEVGVATALDHAIRNDDGVTLRLERDNPYKEGKNDG